MAIPEQTKLNKVYYNITLKNITLKKSRYKKKHDIKKYHDIQKYHRLKNFTLISVY